MRWRVAWWVVSFALCACEALPSATSSRVTRADASTYDDASRADGETSGVGGGSAGEATFPPARPSFANAAAALGIVFERVPAEGWRTLPDRMSGGVCAIDVDGVEPTDFFFAVRSLGGGDSRLFVGKPASDAPFLVRYEEATERYGLDRAEDAIGCLALDVEGDGDQDLVVTTMGGVLLYTRNGAAFDKSVLVRSPRPFTMWTSAAAGDLDGDADLDLVLAGFLDVDPERLPTECDDLPCPLVIQNYPPVRNALLMQEAGRFVDRTAALAPSLLEAEPTLMVAVTDVDGDGPPEIWIGNDLGNAYPNRVLRRDKDGRYRDAADRLGLTHNHYGSGMDTMGWSAGDLNGDLRLDHVMSGFEQTPTAIFLCAEDGYCEDRGHVLGMRASARTFRWAEGLFDFDLDGDLDLVEATGQVFLPEEVAGFGLHGQKAQAPNLYRNDADGMTWWRPDDDEALSVPRSARGLAIADVNLDGRLDVVFAVTEGAPGVLLNRTEPQGHAVRVVLEGRGQNREAALSRVVVTQGARRFIRVRHLGEGYLGNFEAALHFGVPATTPVDIEVTFWPSGRTVLKRNLPVGAAIRVVEP